MIDVDLCRIGVVADLCHKILKTQGDKAHIALQGGQYEDAYMCMVHLEAAEKTLDTLQIVLNMMLKANATIH